MAGVINRAKSYSSLKRFLALSAIAISVLFFLGLILAGGSGLIARISLSVSGNVYLSAFVFVVVTACLLELVLFPINYARSFRIEHDFGLSRQGFFSWIADYIKGLALGGVLFSGLFFAFYFFLIRFPHIWWIYAGIVYFLASIVLAKIFPMLVIPMFYKLSKISDSSLKDRIKELAERAGVKILDIYNIGLGAKTSKANAAVCGIGKTKRILLSDTLIEKYTQEEIEVTLAHELSHHKHQHFWKLNLLNLMVTAFGLYLIDLLLSTLLLHGVIAAKYSMIVFPFIGLFFVLYIFITLPALNFISRRYEVQADQDAISLTGKPHALSGLMKKLSEQNLLDPSPGVLAKIFFYDHPPASERIAMAENYKKI